MYNTTLNVFKDKIYGGIDEGNYSHSEWRIASQNKIYQ